MSLDKFSLERVFASWKQQYGQSMTSKAGTEYYSIPLNAGERRALLNILFHILIEEHGYKLEDFGSLFTSYLIEACVYTEMNDKKKLERIKSAIKFDILHVLGEIFPNGKPKNVNKVFEGATPAKPQESDYEPNALDITKIKGIIPPASLVDPTIDLLADLDEDEE